MRGIRALALVVGAFAPLASCGGAASPAPVTASDVIAARFPLAAKDDRALCDALLARDAASHDIAIDREPRKRRKLIVSDLHLGPGTRDPRFAGIEDFFADTEWAAMVDREGAEQPVDLIIAGDFIEFWQIASALAALPRVEDASQPEGAVLGADQAFAVTAIELVIAAHPDVFRALGRLLDRGDHRVILVAGNHDADLLWPKVQLAIARAVGSARAADPARLVFAEAAAYEHAGVHVGHGHTYDAANRFATQHSPFGRDRDGRCRLQTNWGELFVDRFYTETERQVPFIDNLYPESAAFLWALRDNPDPKRDIGAALRMIDLVRAAQGRGLNRDAIGSALQTALGGGKGPRGPESVSEVVEHVTDRLLRGDSSMPGILQALLRLRFDPQLAGLADSLARAAKALPDVGAALAAVRTIEPAALAHLHSMLFGDPLETAAQRIIENRGVSVAVFGHNHLIGGAVKDITSKRGRGYYANTGSWISVASVADLRARGIGWDRLSLADRATFPSKHTTIVIDYAVDGAPLEPVIRGAPR
jgi:UDP-2,3-diacylglucosamine pyrophosphatase LpxH